MSGCSAGGRLRGVGCAVAPSAGKQQCCWDIQWLSTLDFSTVHGGSWVQRILKRGQNAAAATSLYATASLQYMLLCQLPLHAAKLCCNNTSNACLRFAAILQ